MLTIQVRLMRAADAAAAVRIVLARWCLSIRVLTICSNHAATTAYVRTTSAAATDPVRILSVLLTRWRSVRVLPIVLLRDRCAAIRLLPITISAAAAAELGGRSLRRPIRVLPVIVPATSTCRVRALGTLLHVRVLTLLLFWVVQTRLRAGTARAVRVLSIAVTVSHIAVASKLLAAEAIVIATRGVGLLLHVVH